MLDLPKDIQSFLSKVFKFRIVTVFRLNYGYIVLTSVFVVIRQSNQVSLKISDNLRIKILAGALFHLCLCLV